VGLYKLASLGVGLAVVYMGYRLLLSGVWGKPTEMEVVLKDNRLMMKSAAPGAFFALFGSIIVVFALWKGYTLKTTEGFGERIYSPLFQEEIPLRKPIHFIPFERSLIGYGAGEYPSIDGACEEDGLIPSISPEPLLIPNSVSDSVPLGNGEWPILE